MLRTDSCGGALCHGGTNLTAIQLSLDVSSTKHADCATCHGPDAPGYAKTAIEGHHTGCVDCHGAAGHAAKHDVLRDGSCTGAQCHAGTNLTAIELSPDVPSTKHADCVTCHGPDAPGYAKTAIQGHHTGCVDCHGAAGHTAKHDVSDRIDDCTICHAGTNLIGLHKDCATCHESAKAAVGVDLRPRHGLRRVSRLEPASEPGRGSRRRSARPVHVVLQAPAAVHVIPVTASAPATE